MKLRINIVLFLLLNCFLFSSVAMGAEATAKKKKKKKTEEKAALPVQGLTPEQIRLLLPGSCPPESSERL